MSAKSILEADGKAILNYHLTRAPVIKPTPLPASATHNPPSKLASLYFAADADVKGVLDQAEATYPWLLTPGSKFVAKPDQLIKRRGKSGLLALNKTWAEAREWIEARAGKEQRVETVDGVLRQFLVEPFVPHPQDTEYYININSVREVRPLLSFCPSFLHVVSEASSVRRTRTRVKGIFRRFRQKVAAQVGAERKVGSNKRGRPPWFC
jgi:ATP citrate (pro-S)-lyase